MGMKEFLAKQIEKKQQFKQAKEEADIRKRVEQSQRSPDQRQLEHYLEIERQKSIKENLEQFKRRDQENMFKGSVFGGGNVFSDRPLKFI